MSPPFKRGDVLVLLNNADYSSVADVGDLFVVMETTGEVGEVLLSVRRIPVPRNHSIDYYMYAHRFAKVGEVQDAV